MRVALYGHGRMGRHHARHLAAQGHEVVVRDPAFGTTEDPGRIDAVVVATPTTTHAEVATPWLERGVPTLVEKPLAGTLAEARALAAFPTLSVGHVERYNPAFVALRAAEPEARFVQAERLGAWVERGIDVDVVFDLMVHDLDLFLLLTRSPVTEVRSNGLSVTTNTVDLAHARVAAASGAVGVFSASRISRRPVRAFRCFAPGAYWSLDLAAGVGLRVGHDLVEHPMAVAAADALGEELRAFLAAGSGPMPVPGHEALAAIELAERIRCAC